MLRFLGFRPRSTPNCRTEREIADQSQAKYLATHPKLRSLLEAESVKDPLAFRVAFTGAGAIAYGIPSSGGVLLKHCNMVDLEHIGVSRSSPTRRPCRSQNETEDTILGEEEWCRKLRTLAPKWYRSISDTVNYVHGTDRPPTKIEQKLVYIGHDYVLDKVLVLRFTNRLDRPQDWGRFELCLNMEERCKVMRQFGAIEYASIEDIEELSEQYDQKMKEERQEYDDRNRFTAGMIRDYEP